MKRRDVGKLGACFALVFAFSLSMGGWSWAQEGICIFPSGTGEVTYPPGWGEPVLAVYASDDKVSRGGSIEVWVESDGHGCAPYQWQVTGMGFHFDGISGPEVTTTEGEWQALQVWADSTACGSAFITVTDGCGALAETSIREPGYGRWVLVEEITCGTVDERAGSGNCQSRFYCTEGAYQYLDAYAAGTTMDMRWHPIGNCEKYPCTPYDRNYCYDPGYYPPFYHVGIYYKKKWRWDCP